jgi:hypothetical protein
MPHPSERGPTLTEFTPADHHGSLGYRALPRVFPRLVRYPSHPATPQGATA